jgi:hypothetical protein
VTVVTTPMLVKAALVSADRTAGRTVTEELPDA